jgi:hypothetical protein
MLADEFKNSSSPQARSCFFLPWLLTRGAAATSEFTRGAAGTSDFTRGAEGTSVSPAAQRVRLRHLKSGRRRCGPLNITFAFVLARFVDFQNASV